MALKVKDAATSAQKYVTNASAAAPAYTTGVSGAGNSWQTATAASATTWQAGVQAAASSGRFANSVTPAAANKYQTRASTVGAQRYPAGVASAQTAYQNGVAPYTAVLQNLTLPPRQPKGSPANNQRVAVVTAALRAKKLGTATS
jgi:hypothetical protein